MEKRTPINEVIFEEVRQAFADVDTGPGAIYQQIHYHLMHGIDEVATRLSYYASELYLEEDTDGMSDTDKFLEVFRRTAFGVLNGGVYSSSVYEAYVASMEHTRDYLLGILRSVKEQGNGDT